MTWEQLSTKKYYKMREALTSEKEDMQVTVAILAAYKDVSEEAVEAMHIQDVIDEMRNINQFLKETPSFKDRAHFEWKGENYYIKDLADDTFGAYAAFESILAKYTESDYRLVTYGLAILARKKDEKFESYNIEKRAELFEELPICISLGVSSFFLHKEESLRNVTAICMDIQKRVAALPKGMSKRLFSKDGAGMPVPTPLLLSWMMWVSFSTKLRNKFYYICRAFKTIMKCNKKYKASEMQ